jgi:hypothetical protein
MIYFISGHIDVDEEFFNLHYKEKIDEAINNNGNFIIGDAVGIDRFAQIYLYDKLKNEQHRLTIYHMFDKPRFLINNNIKCIGGFKSDNDRDKAMTLNSDIDIAYVRTNEECKILYGDKYDPKRKNGTLKNIERRKKL